MYQRKNVVYIPYWIQELCGRNSLPLESVLDYNKIGPLLSMEEQAQFLGLQSYTLYDCDFNAQGIPNPFSTVVGNWNGITDYSNGSLREFWRKSIPKSETSLVSMIEGSEYLAYTAGVVEQPLAARLFSADAKLERHKKPFITYDLTRDAVGVVVFPGYFNQENFSSFKRELCVSILKVLYVQNTYAAECKTPYFKSYLEDLALTNS